MLSKLYLYAWTVIATAFLLFTLAGAMTFNTLVVFGFVVFGMVFMGMIAVLPSSVSHPIQKVETGPAKVSREPVTVTIQHGAHSLRA